MFTDCVEMFGDSLLHPCPLTSAGSQREFFLGNFLTSTLMPYVYVHIRETTLEAQLTCDEHHRRMGVSL